MHRKMSEPVEVKKKTPRRRKGEVLPVWTRRQVFNGSAMKTAGGLTRDDLVKVNNRIKSKRAMAAMRARYNDPQYAHVRAKFEANRATPFTARSASPG